MPTYEFRCRTCGTTFTQQRPMAESMAPAQCPDGHDDTVRLLNVAGVATGARSVAAPAAAGGSGGGGGCCGGGCCS